MAASTRRFWWMMALALAAAIPSLGQGKAKGDSLRFIAPYLFNFGGGFRIETQAARGGGSNGGLPESSVLIEFGPRVSYLISGRVGLGGQVLARIHNQEFETQVNGTTLLNRLSEGRVTFYPQATFYQPLIDRLYVFQQASFGFGRGSLEATTLTAAGDKVDEQGYKVNIFEPRVGIGLLYFVRDQVAFSLQAAYGFGFERVSSYGTELPTGAYILPPGSYTRQGLLVQFGLEVFLQIKREKK